MKTEENRDRNKSGKQGGNPDQKKRDEGTKRPDGTPDRNREGSPDRNREGKSNRDADGNR